MTTLRNMVDTVITTAEAAQRAAEGAAVAAETATAPMRADLERLGGNITEQRADLEHNAQRVADLEAAVDVLVVDMLTGGAADV